MQLNSYIFLLLFLPITWVVYWYALRSSTARQIGLLIACLAFYAYYSLGYLFLLLVMAGITFLSARYLLQSQAPVRRYLGLALGLSNLAVLALFKYGEFLHAPLVQYLASFDAGNLIRLTFLVLPLGMSFYVFNLVSYILDVYSGRISPAGSIVEFAVFATFFPTISSGPLIRFKNFSSQVEASSHDLKPNTSQLETGLFRVIMGLAKKLIIADYLASKINPLFAKYDQLAFVTAWLVVLAYAYQLYFDFSGYTDIAIGVGYLFGFSLPENFAAPYASGSITEFWQRWHMTLSTWLREYLFFPLSRALRKSYRQASANVLRSVSLIITMVAIGWWHGASWTFLVWGLYHGVLLAVNAWVRLPGTSRWMAILSRALTFLAVVLGWVIFRSTSLPMAGTILSALFGMRGLFDPFFASTLGKQFPIILAALMLITHTASEARFAAPRLTWTYAVGLAVLLAISLVLLGQPHTFIYFQF